MAIPEEPGLPLLPGPIIEFKGAYPFDTQSVLEVTSDNSRAFVAEGAAITILNLNSISGSPPVPTVIDRVALENAAPLALRYYAHPVSGQSYLFVAGGTMGLWRMSLCPTVMVPPPGTPSKCICAIGACDPYARVRIDIVEDQASFMRKRCVDLTIVEGNPAAGNVPILCVLFSARANMPMPFGPTEMRTYLLNSNGTVSPYGSPLFLGTPLVPQSNAVGNSIIADPGDSNSVYVSMGTGWLYKVNLTAQPFSAAQHGLVPSGCPAPPLPTCTNGEQMRDLAIVRTPLHGSVIYAALDYGRVLEFQLGPTTTTTAFTVSIPDKSGKYPGRIQAVTQGENVLLTLGMSRSAGTVADTSHILTTGGWTKFHQSPFLDDPNGAPDQEPLISETKEIFFYKRDLSTAVPGLTSLGQRPVNGASWGSLVLRRVAQNLHRVYASPLLIAHDVTNAFGASSISVNPVLSFHSRELSVTDGTVSILNSQLTYFGADGAANMLQVSAEGVFQPVLDGDLCGGVPPAGVPMCVGTKFPNPFIYASVQEVANWVDPVEPYEWFVAGGPTWRRIDPAGPTGCTTNAPDDCSPSDPCGIGPFYWRNNRTLPHDQIPDVGWFVVKMKTASIGGGPPSAAASDMKWWQLDSPPTTGEKSEGHDYLTSEVDPRQVIVNGVSQGPRYIHCVRTGSNRGLKVFDRADLVLSTTQTCQSTSPGKGEHMRTPDLVEYETHPEIDTGPQYCKINVEIAFPFIDNPRNLFNNKTAVFSIAAPDGTLRWIIAVTQGWVAAGPVPAAAQVSTCLGPGTWSEEYGKALLAFYDITNPLIQPWPPPPPGPVPPIRVGLSTVQGHAWAVEVKTYPSGETYAFVADFSGKLLVFPASYSDLFAPSKSPYIPGDALDPVKVYRFPGDASDLMPANCIDLELDGDLLYCALGRAGLGVVDIGNPLDPVLCYLIDTPGLVEGIVKRRINNKDQLVTSDTRCGMRLFGRVGE